MGIVELAHSFCLQLERDILVPVQQLRRI
jgi:hypothetical protein